MGGALLACQGEEAPANKEDAGEKVHGKAKGCCWLCSAAAALLRGSASDAWPGLRPEKMGQHFGIDLGRG